MDLTATLDEIIPKLKKGFYCLLGGYIVWCLLKRSFLHFSFGHYCNIVTGVFVCVLTLSAGYFLGNHKFKKDYSYSIYLYHMIVINLLVVIGMKENLRALVITYVVTLLLSFVSTNYVAKGNQIMRMGSYQSYNLMITVVIFSYYIIKNKNSLGQLDFLTGYLIVSFLAILIIPVLWGELSIWKAYLASYCLILLPWMITKSIDLDKFKQVYLNIMLFICCIAIVCFVFPNMTSIFPHSFLKTSSNSWDYDFYFVYAKYANAYNSVLQRNIGVFWEPGMFQGFVITAMILKAIDNHKITIKSVAYQLVMIICIFTIQSTTGYILLLPVALIYILKILNRYSRKLRVVVTVIILLTVIAVFLNENILQGIVNAVSPDIATKLDVSTSISGSTRWYGILGDAILVFKHPLGIGINHMVDEKNSIINVLTSISSGASTNTTLNMMLKYGVISGVMYLIICIRACFRMTNDNLCNISIFIVMMIIINTEPHYLTLFFMTLFMYYAGKERQSENRYLL